MNFTTKGELIQALKDYDIVKEQIEKKKKEIEDIEYLRYGKVRSPLDYDIVKYRNGEAVRQIKGRGSYNSEVVHDKQAELENRLAKLQADLGKLEARIRNTDEDLKMIDPPLNNYLVLRYKRHKTLRQVIKITGIRTNEGGMHKYIMRGLEKYYEK